MGGIVTITGLFVGIQIKDPPLSLEEQQQPKKRFMEDLISTFKPETVKNNPILYLLLLHMALNGVAGQITSPYLFVYIENYLGFSKGELSLIGGGVILIVAIIFGVFACTNKNQSLLSQEDRDKITNEIEEVTKSIYEGMNDLNVEKAFKKSFFKLP